jgi:Uma2 family endonuclease
MNTTTSTVRATLDDLMRFDGKAELIGGRIVEFMASGYLPGLVAGRIFRSLDDFRRAIGRGFAAGDGLGFAVPELTSGRESFSPDAAFSFGPLPTDPMDFVPGAPTFAVEVRSKSDYGPAADADIAAKRADYFEAGTLVVWDVDPVAGLIRSYRHDAPAPATFAAGQVADAEPAVPGWRIAVDELLA